MNPIQFKIISIEETNKNIAQNKSLNDPPFELAACVNLEEARSKLFSSNTPLPCFIIVQSKNAEETARIFEQTLFVLAILVFSKDSDGAELQKQTEILQQYQKIICLTNDFKIIIQKLQEQKQKILNLLCCVNQAANMFEQNQIYYAFIKELIEGKFIQNNQSTETTTNNEFQVVQENQSALSSRDYKQIFRNKIQIVALQNSFKDQQGLKQINDDLYACLFIDKELLKKQDEKASVWEKDTIFLFKGFLMATDQHAAKQLIYCQQNKEKQNIMLRIKKESLGQTKFKEIGISVIGKRKCYLFDINQGFQVVAVQQESICSINFQKVDISLIDLSDYYKQEQLDELIHPMLAFLHNEKATFQFQNKFFEEALNSYWRAFSMRIQGQFMANRKESIDEAEIAKQFYELCYNMGKTYSQLQQAEEAVRYFKLAEQTQDIGLRKTAEDKRKEIQRN